MSGAAPGRGTTTAATGKTRVTARTKGNRAGAGSLARAQGRRADVVVRPVTEETWRDFRALFEARGSPHYCWCGVYKFKNAHLMKGEEKREAMGELVRGGTPIGVLAYAEGGTRPVGWCSIAPRESYVKLARSRTMPRQ